MNVRLVISAILCAAAFPLNAGNISAEAEAYSRFIRWKGKDEVVVFPLVTDLHLNYATRTFFDCFERQMASDSLFHYDFIANLGDICTKMSDRLIDDVARRMLSHDGISIYLPGNHDYDGEQGHRYTQEELSGALLDPFIPRSGGRLHRVEGESYGWYDIPEKSTRVIFLDSMQTGTGNGKYYTYGEAQLEWLDGMLRNMPKKWNAVVLSHFMPHVKYGLWNPEKELAGSTMDATIWKLRNVLARFVADGGRLVGLFCGDAHCSAYDCLDGVNMYVSQGLGGYPKECIREGISHVQCDFNRDMLLDVVAFKPRSREVAVFRVGAGGESLDRHFTYASRSARGHYSRVGTEKKLNVRRDGWNLAWSCEFNHGRKRGMDHSLWKFTTPTAQNGYRRQHRSDPSLLYERDGMMTVWGRRADADDNGPTELGFVSAGVSTKGTASFSLGSDGLRSRIEFRARKTEARGWWPALWLVSNDSVYPDGGEIDIVEHINYEKVFYQTVHTRETMEDPSKPQAWHTEVPIDDVTGWHVYAVEGDSEGLYFYVDDVFTGAYMKKGFPEYEYQFDRDEYFLLIDGQLGGIWVNCEYEPQGIRVPDGTDLPARMDVDYVRYYKKVR